MADTVQDLIDLLKVKLHGYKYAQSGQDADLIKILNSAQHTLWMLMVTAGRANGGSGNWFIKKATLTLNGVRDADLPADCHDVAFVECSTAGWEAVQFKAGAWWKQVFQEQRRQAGTAAPTDGARFFVVSGGATPKFSLDRIPNASIDLGVWYTYIFTDWTAAGDSIALIPRPYRDALVNYAASQIISADQDPAIAAQWQGYWGEHKTFVSAVAAQRQIADIVPVAPFDRSG